MGLFVGSKDYLFFTGINTEIINQVIDTTIILYSLDKTENQPNIYGENTQKIYKIGLECHALITHDDQVTQDGPEGPNVFQNIICGFQRLTLENLDFYPEQGDIIKWNHAYYEITHVIDNQLIAGRIGLPHSIICTAVMVNRSSINIRNEYGV